MVTFAVLGPVPVVRRLRAHDLGEQGRLRFISVRLFCVATGHGRSTSCGRRRAGVGAGLHAAPKGRVVFGLSGCGLSRCRRRVRWIVLSGGLGAGGDVVAGSPSFDVIGALCDDDDENTVLERLRERWSAYVVGVSYAANCGDASARGDGVCPVATALSLDGAENVILPGVYHGANIGDPWYGSPDVIDAWSSHCLP